MGKTKYFSVFTPVLMLIVLLPPLLGCSVPLSPSESSPMRGGALAPGVHIVDPFSAKRSLTRFRGKPVLLTFWAPWCYLCLGELPSLVKLGEQFSTSEFEIVLVAIQASADEVRECAAKHKIPFRIFLDSKDEARTRFEIRDLPLSVMLDRSGNIVAFPDPASKIKAIRFEGPRDWGDYETVQNVKKLIGE